MEKSPNKRMGFLDGGPASNALKAAKNLISSILITLKNYALYPDDHINCQKSVENVKVCLDTFLKNQNTIRFYVEKEQILFQGNIVYQEASGGSLASVLYRDGIRWLEFQNGIETREIIGFLRLLIQYKVLKEEAEGDMVTALWEENFPHLRYEAREPFWETEPLIDLSQLKVAGRTCHDKDPRTEEQPCFSLAHPAVDRSLWKLTHEEIKTLRRMVWIEENQQGSDDVLDVLVVILEEQNKEEDVKTILEFMKEEFQSILEQGEFQLAYRLFKCLHEIRRAYETEKPWAIPLLDNFFTEISGPQILGVLHQVCPAPDTWDSEQIKMFSKVLCFFSPEAILTLCPMSVQMSSRQIRKVLVNRTVSMANKDIRPLERLLNGLEDDMLTLRIIHILGHLRSRESIRILFNMIRHPSEKVRKEALRTLLKLNPRILRKLFRLIEDPGDAVRETMLTHLGQFRDEHAEHLLLDYLEHRRFQRIDSHHVKACYRALGKCGSSVSIPFLQKVLLEQGWKSMFSIDKSVERQAAALALMEMRTNKANEILKKASESLYSGVRIAYQKAIEDKRQQLKSDQ